MKTTKFSTTLAALLLTLSMSANPHFRATWISTVANIDWPSRAAIGNDSLQKAEMIRMLDAYQKLNMNAVIFQVRPTADALYASTLEPWSAWLTGKQGKAPGYDPLQFIVEQAHQRGIDVHVWINPYRITGGGSKIENLSPDHVYYQHPEWFWKYGAQWYFEPGLDETRQWLCSVVKELVSNYDIQAIHMDDYFYPYPIKGEAFPDSACYANHPRGCKTIDEWRRNNVNLAIKEVHETIVRANPKVEFGISPFGIWRNKNKDPRGSETSGLTNYDELYADVLLWMENGWIDYVCPQLYWYMGQKGSDYAILAKWWAENNYGCRVYTGMAPYRMLDKKQAQSWHEGNEICRQLRYNQQFPQITGECYFSAKTLLINAAGLADSLKSQFYTTYVPAPRKVIMR